MGAWLIRKNPKARRYLGRLASRPQAEQDAFAEAERLLAETPYPRDYPAGVISHLKGGYHCHHEYRNLPNAQRIFYKIWSREDISDAIKKKLPNVPEEPVWEEGQLGLVIFIMVGPHPKEKGRT